MGVYNRGRPGGPQNLWIAYAIPKALAAEHGVRRSVREPAGSDAREAARLLARRRREIAEGTWRPANAPSSTSTLEVYAARWLAGRVRSGVSGVRDEAQRLRDYVLPALGRRALADVTRGDVKALVAGLDSITSARTGRPLAPRTKRHVYNDLRCLFGDAVADGVVSVSPCTLREKRGELPKKRDADKRWRSSAVFAREEVEALLSDERIPEQRRTLYALIFLAGLRIGEAVARQWRDYDPVARPLGRLVVATQHDQDDTKTEATREVPVHPTLAAMLARWRLDYEPIHGRKPGPEQLIVPNRAKTRSPDAPIDGRRAWQNLQRDLQVLGLRPRRVHDARRTFISLCLADGADKYLLQWATHGRPDSDAFDGYASPPWAALCEQVAKLQLRLRGAEPVASLDARRAR